MLTNIAFVAKVLRVTEWEKKVFIFKPKIIHRLQRQKCTIISKEQQNKICTPKKVQIPTYFQNRSWTKTHLSLATFCICMKSV